MSRPEIPTALPLAKKPPAWLRIGHGGGLEMWQSAPDTSDGLWPSQDAPQLAMARFLRASCLLSLLLAGFVPPGRGQEKSKTDCHGGMSGTIYDYGALTIDGEEYIPFKQYAGKYVLFVNVASY